ncbi:MAG: LmbE family protein, partial [Flavobacteriaceae bacterium]|nr:LmbE family protein [Flavobacteriaceae bacterium]
YDHIPKQIVLLPAESKLVKSNIKIEGKKIAYIQGAGDDVPSGLTQIGYEVTELKQSDITAERLKAFDAVVTGIRVYNVLDDFEPQQKILLQYVADGGTLLVQYNTDSRLKTTDFSPYPIKLSRNRVTEEDAEVRLLNPGHEVLNFPNKINNLDFSGWVQERGLYFPGEWGSEFTTIFGMNDFKEPESQGSLLVSKYGKGYYIYTGLSFFRQIPAGVPGAYKLFANLISIGKNGK